MNFWSFVAGPLLRITFLVVIVGIFTRIAFFSYTILKSSKNKDSRWSYVLTTFLRSVLPFYKAVAKKPLYATIRYIFHVCLIVVPIWTSGHIILLNLSRFGWYWAPLPDAWVDWMTLLLLGLAAFFLFRRIVSVDIHLNSSKSDYFLIIITALPFLTGFIAYHQWFDYKTMLIIHILSGEAMLLVAAFLFCTTRLNADKCTGCAACELSCPTGTLESNDEGKLRIFTYFHYQCICCGACVNTCPEEAAELRHKISPGKFFQIVSKQEIRSVKLKVCERCGKSFAPTPQLEQVERKMAEKKIKVLELKYCDRCKRRFILDQISSKKQLSK